MSWVRELLISEGIATDEELEGLTAHELDDLEKRIGMTLPVAYKQFLKVAGKSAGVLGLDIDLFYPEVLGLKSDAEELILECKPGYVLPPDAFVFCGYQSFQYHFFRCGCGDPPVWHFLDDESRPSVVTETFSSFLHEMVATTLRPS